MPEATEPKEAQPVAESTIRLRVRSRHLMNAALLTLLPLLISPFLNMTRAIVIDPDVWWHMADARILWTTHHFIWTEPYSFTVAGAQWINPEWLAEFPFYFAYAGLGLQGIYLVSWLLVAANALFVYWRSVKLTGQGGSSLYAAGIALVMMTVNCGPRTIQIAYLAMGLELLILEQLERGDRRLLWLLPPLFCVWINMHGSWVIGLALFGLYIACGLIRWNMGSIQQEKFATPLRNKLFTVFAACVAALFVNPYGWRLLWNPFDMMLNQGTNTGAVSEWKPLTFGTLEGGAVLAAVVIFVVTSCLKSRTWKAWEMGFLLFAFFAAFDHHRFAYLAAVIVTPMLAEAIKRAEISDADEKTIPGMNFLLAAAAVVGMVLMFPSEKVLKKGLDTWFPPSLLASIEPQWRTWNWDDLGGMMTYMGKPNFIDSRFDTFEHHGILQDYLPAMYGTDSLAILDKYRIDHVLVMENMPLSYLLTHTGGWHVVGREGSGSETFVLYARNAAPPAAPVQK
ncbi:MAG TPA: hypothetical protein VF392_16605 [Terracidiphilus sp.]